MLHSSPYTLAFKPIHNYTVCIDAGHGGADPGKISASGILEKDINLKIALQCKKILEQNGVHVIMTRTQDKSLSSPDSPHPKREDLEARKNIMTNPSIHCAISIHQNSFPDTTQHGAQVFYNPSLTENKTLAESVQANLTNLTYTPSTRSIKENADYYLLRNNPVPTVIAEICFLSNPSEADMIASQDIQERAAFCLALGILQYLHQQ